MLINMIPIKTVLGKPFLNKKTGKCEKFKRFPRSLRLQDATKRHPASAGQRLEALKMRKGFLTVCFKKSVLLKGLHPRNCRNDQPDRKNTEQPYCQRIKPKKHRKE